MPYPRRVVSALGNRASPSELDPSRTLFVLSNRPLSALASLRAPDSTGQLVGVGEGAVEMVTTGGLGIATVAKLGSTVKLTAGHPMTPSKV